MSNCSASCTSVRSPLIAAIATFALKADVWFRRGLLLMLSPDSRAKSCPLSGRSSTYRPVQILEAGSNVGGFENLDDCPRTKAGDSNQGGLDVGSAAVIELPVSSVGAANAKQDQHEHCIDRLHL